VRGFLSTLGKKIKVEKITREYGTSAYRITE
jgi:hypothetical protein